MSIGELEGVQEMYHDLGETSHLVRGLVFGIRPFDRLAIRGYRCPHWTISLLMGS